MRNAALFFLPLLLAGCLDMAKREPSPSPAPSSSTTEEPDEESTSESETGGDIDPDEAMEGGDWGSTTGD